MWRLRSSLVIAVNIPAGMKKQARQQEVSSEQALKQMLLVAYFLWAGLDFKFPFKSQFICVLNNEIAFVLGCKEHCWRNVGTILFKRFAMEMAAVEYQHTNKTKWSVADSSLCKMIAGQAWGSSFVTRTCEKG